MNWIIRSIVSGKLILSFSLFCFLVLSSCGESRKQEERAGESPVETPEEEKEETGTILFFGNSLTAGMGLDPQEAFPAIIQQKIDSLELPYRVINAGLSGETSAAGRNRQIAIQL